MATGIEPAAPLPMRRSVGVADALGNRTDADVAEIDQPRLLSGIRVGGGLAPAWPYSNGGTKARQGRDLGLRGVLMGLGALPSGCGWSLIATLARPRVIEEVQGRIDLL
jgi:hypothetical protein